MKDICNKMSCHICNPLAVLPCSSDTYNVCRGCFEAAKSLIRSSYKSGSAEGFSIKSLTDVSKWALDRMKDISELKQKSRFLSFGSTFRDQLHTDILVHPGNNGPPIPAHRALLANRSEIFNNILDSSDECKPLQPKEKAPLMTNMHTAISVPELNHEELESFMEFLYTADLTEERMNKHVYSLSLAADKYRIPHLLKFCERHMMKNLNSSNVLDVLEVASVHADLVKRAALDYIVKNKHQILFSAKYEALALKNPPLCMQITRAFAD